MDDGEDGQGSGSEFVNKNAAEYSGQEVWEANNADQSRRFCFTYTKTDCPIRKEGKNCIDPNVQEKHMNDQQ